MQANVVSMKCLLNRRLRRKCEIIRHQEKNETKNNAGGSILLNAVGE